MTRSESFQMADEASLLRFCAPVFFLPSSVPEPLTIVANATVSLVDTGQKKLLITSAHVWTEFQDYQIQNPQAHLAVLFISGFGFPEYLDEKLLVDFDKDLDIAVFEAHENTWKMGGKEFYKVYRWPISRANVGDALAFLGFAGEGRQTTAGTGKFDYSFFGLSVTASSDRKLFIGNASGKHTLLNNEGKPIPKMKMGGMSGSPAYVLNRQGIFRLAGFVQMGDTSDDPVFIVHAYFLNADGTLKRDSI